MGALMPSGHARSRGFSAGWAAPAPVGPAWRPQRAGVPAARSSPRWPEDGPPLPASGATSPFFREDRWLRSPSGQRRIVEHRVR